MRLYISVLLTLLCFCACSGVTSETLAEAPAETEIETEISGYGLAEIQASVLPQIPEEAEDEPVETETASEPDEPNEPETPGEIDYNVIKPNESGNIMVIMYHGLSDGNNKYDRSERDFINDLNVLYNQGYHLISMKDLTEGNISTPAGCTPVALTFDDGKSSAFSMIEQDGELVPSPGCMVDIINRFCEEHPDFGKAGAFYIMGRGGEAFSGAGTLAERFNYLIGNGFELGNHTWSHGQLSNMNAARIQEEIGKLDRLIRENSDGFIPNTLTYPYGLRPKASLRQYVLEGSYNGEEYAYAWGIREAPSNITANPFHVAFDRLNVPRVRATDDSNAEYDVQDLGYFLRFYQNNPERRFISDGDPNRISVPESLKHLINPEAIGERELFIYGETAP